MEEQEELHPEEKAQLESFKNAILSKIDLFESIGFCKSEFESVINNICDLATANQILYFAAVEFLDFDGYTGIRDVALKNLKKWKLEFYQILKISPLPFKFAEDAFTEIQQDIPHFNETEYLTLGFKRGITYGFRLEEYIRHPGFSAKKVRGLGRHGYRDAISGNNDILRDYFIKYADVCYSHWSTGESFSGKSIDENFTEFANSEILLKEDMEMPFECVLSAIKYYELAYREKFVSDVMNMLKAGNSITSIYEELIQEDVQESATKAPNTPPKSHNTAVSTEAKNAGLELIAIALLHFYKDEPITPKNAPEIAVKYGYKPGRALYNKYNESTPKSARLLHGGTVRQLTKRLAILEEIRQQIPQSKDLEEDIKYLTKRVNKKK